MEFVTFRNKTDAEFVKTIAYGIALIAGIGALIILIIQ